MGNNKKKGLKANVFKRAGAKSLKKTKAKPITFNLKELKHQKSDQKKDNVVDDKIPVQEDSPTVSQKNIELKKELLSIVKVSGKAKNKGITKAVEEKCEMEQ